MSSSKTLNYYQLSFWTNGENYHNTSMNTPSGYIPCDGLNAHPVPLCPVEFRARFEVDFSDQAHRNTVSAGSAIIYCALFHPQHYDPWKSIVNYALGNIWRL